MAEMAEPHKDSKDEETIFKQPSLVRSSPWFETHGGMSTLNTHTHTRAVEKGHGHEVVCRLHIDRERETDMFSTQRVAVVLLEVSKYIPLFHILS